MADWQAANTGAFIPPELNTLIDTAGTTASSAATLLQTIQAAIELLKNFVLGLPVFDWLLGLDQLVQDFKDDFISTGLFSLVMWDYPAFQFRNRGVPGGETFVSSFELDVISAFSDTADDGRPTFTGDAAAIIFVTGVPDVGAAVTSLRAIRDAFTWWEEISQTADQVSRINVTAQVRDVEEAIKRGDIILDDNFSKQTQQLLKLKVAISDANERISSTAFENNIEPLAPTVDSTAKEIQDFITAVDQEVENSTYPDFQEMSLRTFIPALQEVLDRALDPLVAALALGRSIVDTINSFVAAIQAKIDALNNIVAAIGTILDQLDALLNLTELSALFVETTDGVDGLVTEIRNAGNKPLDGLNGFFTGVVLVAGGTSVTSFKNLFGPVGGA